MISVVDSTSKNRLNGGSASDLLTTLNTAERMKNGIMILNISSPPMRNGLNNVVNRYTDAAENEAILAIFPVPKY
jgi:hypothetical protein